MNANSLVILCIVLPFIVLQDQSLACAQHTQLLTSIGIDTSTSMQGPSSISVHTGSSCVDPIVIEPQPNSLESILKDHAAKFVDESSEYLLTVDRTTTEKLWMSIVTFYIWWSSSCCGSMAEHWRLKPEVSWVRLPTTAGFFHFPLFSPHNI